jgi:hypothetical protein
MARRKLTDEEIKFAADRAEGQIEDEAPPNPERGRPSRYRPDFAVQATEWCKRGLTDAEIAFNLSVPVATLFRWKAKYLDFSEALKTGKSVADERVERSLYHKAIGYTFESEKIFQHDGEIIRAKTIEHVPPDTTACIFWLKNRRPDQWRDKSFAELEVKGDVKFIVEGAPAALPMKTIEAVAGDDRTA